MTFDRPLDAIDAEALDALVRDRVSEGRQLEYKETLPGEKDQDKREFLADISAFANSAGGDLIYGIREAGGVAAAVVGLPDVDPDQERLRLEQLARAGIRPRIPGLRLKIIHRGADGADPPCLLVRVPRSGVGLHMVTLGGLNRFYGRGGGGRYPLDVDEIRAGFLVAETAYDRARTWRAERLAAIEAGEGPIRVSGTPTLAFHVIPLAHVTPLVRWEGWGSFVELQDAGRRDLLPLLYGRKAGGHRFNLDGWVGFIPNARPGSEFYVQLFRWGAIEAVGVVPEPYASPHKGRVDGGAVEALIIKAFSKYIEFLAWARIDPPIALGLAVLRARGLKLQRSGIVVLPHSEAFDRDLVVLPEIVAHEPGQPDQADVILRPLLDTLWQAAGWPRSPHYQGGRWQPPGLIPSA
jgi:hypothetical protein